MMAGGRIVGAVVVDGVVDGLFGMEVKVQHLHSTKGWKPPQWERWKSVYAPVIGAFHWADGIGPHKGPEVRHIPGETPLTRARHHHPRSKRDMAIAKAKREYTEGLYGQLR